MDMGTAAFRAATSTEMARRTVGAGEDELIDDLLEDLHIPDLHLDELINATVEEIADDDEVESEDEEDDLASDDEKESADGEEQTRDQR